MTRLVFSAEDSSAGREVWVTDGTASGTSRLADINPGSGSSSPDRFTALADGRLVFRANDGSTGSEPWVTDGTAPGTSRLADINPGSTRIGPNGSEPRDFSALADGRLVFSAFAGSTGFELWVTDGTASGTSRLADINPGSGSSFPDRFTALADGRLVFPANDGSTGSEPWVTDGTAPGTSRLADINPGSSSSFLGYFTALSDGRLVFSAWDGSTGFELWVTDGTAPGTSRLADLRQGSSSSYPGYFTALADGRLVFRTFEGSYDEGSYDYELWVTDGTAPGTSRLADINPGIRTAFSSRYYPTDFTALADGRLVFSASDGSAGAELWVTDGTASGTSRLADINPGSGSSSPDRFTALADGRLVFQATDGSTGRELWVTDGTAQGTSLLADIHSTTEPRYYAFYFTALPDGRLVFSANDGSTGLELWVTDGTAPGTSLLADIRPGYRGSYPGRFTALPDGRLVFSANDGSTGGELWVTDGTAPGTSLLADISPGRTSSYLTEFTSLPAMLAFSGPPAPVAEGDAGSTAFAFTVTRNGDASGAASATWIVTGADASDFALGIRPAGTVEFSPNQTTATITVLVAGDRVFEANETFTVTLLDPRGVGIGAASASASATILNDDAPAPVIALDGGMVVTAEGDTGTTTMVFTVRRSGDSSGQASADWAVTRSGTDPAEADDFAQDMLPSGSVRFADGETTAQIEVSVKGDREVESNETFTLTLSAPVNATLGNAAAEGTILNDDGAISVSGPAAFNEGTGTETPVAFRILRSGDVADPASVTWSVAGTGLRPADAGDFTHGPLSGAVEFGAGEGEKTVTLTVRGDREVENDESFTLTLSNPVGASLGVDRATAIIRNDDTGGAVSGQLLPIVSVRSLGAATEGDPSGPTQFLEFRLTRANNSSDALQVSFALSRISVDEADFVSGLQQAGNIQFAPGQTEQVVRFAIRGDLDAEPSETARLTITGFDRTAAIGVGTAVNTIVDDDAPSFLRVFASSEVQEGDPEGPPSELTFLVTRNGNLNRAVSVDAVLTGITADQDDVGVSLDTPSRIVFAPGESRKSVTVPIIPDIDREAASETVLLALQNPSPTAQIVEGQAGAVILDDDGQARVDVRVAGDGTVAEGNGDGAPNKLRFEFVRTLNTKVDVDVTYRLVSTEADGDDLGNVLDSAFTVTLPATTSTGAELVDTVEHDITGDRLVELNERVTLEILSVSDNAEIGTPAATAVILDDDEIVISVGQARTAVTEGDGLPLFIELVRTVNLDATVEVSYTVAPADGDLTAPQPASPIRFLPGETSKRVEIGVIDDTLLERLESFSFSITSARSLDADGQPDGQGVTLRQRDIPLAIFDNDAPRRANGWGDPHLLTFDGLQYSFQAVGEFTLVEATSGPPLLVQARFAAVPGSDLVSQTTAIATQVGTTRVMIDVTQPVPVLIDGGAIVLADGDALPLGARGVTRQGDVVTIDFGTGEVLQVSLRDGYLDFGLDLAPDRASGSLRGLLGDRDGEASDDLQLPDGTVLVQPISFADLYGAFAEAWRVTDTGSLFFYTPGTGTQDFTDRDFPRAAVDIDQLPSSLVSAALALLDDLGVTDATIRQTAILDYVLTGNLDYLFSSVEAEQPEPVTEIRIEDAPTAQFVSVGTTTPVLLEGNSGAQTVSFTVFRSSPGIGSVEVAWRLQAGPGFVDADDLAPGTALSGAVSFAPDETAQDLFFTVLGDAVREGDERLRIELEVSTSQTDVLIASAAAESVIFNDDATLSIAGAPSPVAEGDSGTTAVSFTVTRTGDISGISTVGWAVTGSGTNPAAAADFAGGVLPAGTVSFAAGEINRNITIEIVGDRMVELDEGFTITLSGASIGTTIVTAATSAIIGNDDRAATVGDDLLTGTPLPDTIYGFAGSDTIDGGSGHDRLVGADGSDRLTGDAGDDTLSGGQGHDLLEGGSGDDRLVGGAGDDALRGGVGNDRYLVDATDVIFEQANEGWDTIVSRVSWELAPEFENLRLVGSAGISGTSNAGGSRLQGNDGNNFLQGREGNDNLLGGAGADTLSGGLGDDRLVGGPGADWFLFGGHSEGLDRIIDFTPNLDVVAISAGAFGFSPGAPPDAHFVSHASNRATAAEGTPQFIYDTRTGNLLFDSDGVGNGSEPLLFAKFVMQFDAPAVTDLLFV